MVDAGKSRCIIYFDELDKTCTKHGINEIFNTLIHVTDPNTNNHFSDAFFNEVTFNLDKVLFVFSYNDPDKIDKILLDRMEKIEVKPYSLHDKLIITKQFLLNEIATDIGVSNDFIQISNADIEYIIEHYTFEPGVRELKRKMENIFLKINLDRIYGREMFAGITDNVSKININRDHIDKYLNKPLLTIKKIHTCDDIGIINGLYATVNGSGGIIPILIYNNYVGTKNKFILKITGSQGKIMKESVEFAFTTAMNLIKDTYRNTFIKSCQFGLHIHTPDGATPKDGPSAGAAFTTGFISRILGIKIKKDIAMTGEIEMNGKITAIGGLLYKLKGAHKAGVKTIFIPKENKEDLDKILLKDILLGQEINIIPVDHISQILKEAFVGNVKGEKFDPTFYLQ
jgi:ATP-dependent Lon protease